MFKINNKIISQPFNVEFPNMVRRALKIKQQILPFWEIMYLRIKLKYTLFINNRLQPSRHLPAQS